MDISNWIYNVKKIAQAFYIGIKYKDLGFSRTKYTFSFNYGSDRVVWIFPRNRFETDKGWNSMSFGKNYKNLRDLDKDWNIHFGIE